VPISTTSADEKREQRRFVIDAPLVVRSGGRTLDPAARLRDLSIGGVFFFSSAPLTPGLPLEVQLTLPKEIGLPRNQDFSCRGVALRVSPAGHRRFGVAAVIHEFRDLQKPSD